uniref:CD33 molecule n=1 Tax=Molossus molossus TaxID=27622 RepID=A0A7J8C626_MOLMO|nr:CD33 molecule [Molossus molossus]
MLWLLLPLLCPGSLAQDPGYTLEVQEAVTVQEGLCVFVPCKVRYGRTTDTPAHGFWFREGDEAMQGAAVATNNPDHAVKVETKGRFHLLGDPLKHNCSLDIRDVRRTDNGSYFFRVVRGPNVKYSYVKNMLSVHVTALNHTPDISIPGTLESGRPRNLTCSVPWACERGTPPIFSWTSAAHTSLGPRTHLSSELTLTPRPQDHGTNLTCQVKFPAVGVTVETTVQLNVSCASQKSTVGDCLGDGTGAPRTTAGVVQGAVWGAGVTALLAVCLCLIYFVVKTHRKKAARAAVSMDSIHPASQPASQDHQKQPKLDIPTDSTNPAGATQTLGSEPELHYASIRFQGVNPQKNAHTIYSNVTTQ